MRYVFLLSKANKSPNSIQQFYYWLNSRTGAIRLFASKMNGIC